MFNLEPYAEKERHKCPFYGFNGMFGVMMDSQGNQCALIVDSYSPCQMEIGGQKPKWNECPLNDDSQDRIKEIAEDMAVFPNEFHPPTRSSWEGMPLKMWMEYILNKKD